MVLKESDNTNNFGNQSLGVDGQAGRHILTLAHISDPHISCMKAVRARHLFNKRLFGFLKWNLHRGREHEIRVLEALQNDLSQTRPDQIAVTGDLTHLSLPAEFKEARQWLQTLGPPERVMVVPGNHDVYVKDGRREILAHWTDYMLSDDTPAAEHAAEDPDAIFPSLRVRGPVALIGVCTARPSAPHLAVGSIGASQMQKLASILAAAAEQQLFRVILIHHPPTSGVVNWRKRLTDAGDLQSLLKRYGSELILHGHAHRHFQSFLKTPTGKVPVMGAPSASSLGRTPRRRARYYIYRIAARANGYEVSAAARIYSQEENRFILEGEHQFGRTLRQAS
jgi:3',5'-cyclic AMP phosphodiesterase CpdA